MQFRAHIFSIVFLLSFFAGYSQMHEFGVMFGGSSYFGDLNTQSKLKISVPATSFSYRANFFNKYLTGKIALTTAKVSFADNLSNNSYLQNRNLEFYSSITEFSGALEFHFLKYYKADRETAWSPYFFLGIGIFKFSPKRNYEGTKYDLKALGTEGQVTIRQDVNQYSLTQLALPYGVGVKYGMSKHFALIFEAGLRKTSTDYLDDVSQFYPDDDVILRYNKDNPESSILLSDTSNDNVNKEGKQRGNNSKNDGYLIFGLSLTYTIHTAKCPLVY